MWNIVLTVEYQGALSSSSFVPPSRLITLRAILLRWP